MAASKMPEYIANRIAGLDPTAAGLAAGYSLAGLAVTICNLEKREDVRAAIRKGKRSSGVDKVPRHGVGPKDPLKPWGLKDSYDDPLELMLDVMNNREAPASLRIQCAKDAMPYCHARKEGGKRDSEKATAHKTNEKSKFGTGRKPTHLQAVA